MELGFRVLQGQDGHTAGRELLAEIYKKLTGQTPPTIETTPRGKPYFVDSPWHFSISHTKNHVFCCLSQKPIGIDAEEADRIVDPRLAQRYLSAMEQTHLANAPDRNAALLRLWVLKEAYAKLTGQGIGNYLKNTDFDPNDSRILEMDGCVVAILEGESPCSSTPTPT